MTSVIFVWSQGASAFLCPKGGIYVNFTRAHLPDRPCAGRAVSEAEAAAHHRHAGDGHPAGAVRAQRAGRLDFVDLSRPAQARARYYPAQGGTVARFGRPQKGRPSGDPDVVPARNVRDHRLCAARAVLPRRHARGGGGHGRGARGGVARGRRAAHGAADGKRPRNGQEHPADDPGRRIVRRYLRHCAVYNVSAHGAGRQRQRRGLFEHPCVDRARRCAGCACRVVAQPLFRDCLCPSALHPQQHEGHHRAGCVLPARGGRGLARGRCPRFGTARSRQYGLPSQDEVHAVRCQAAL